MQSMQTFELVLRMICLYGYTGYLNSHMCTQQICNGICVYIYIALETSMAYLI